MMLPAGLRRDSRRSLLRSVARSDALRALLAAGVLACAAGSVWVARAVDAQEVGEGSFLIASPELADPNFSRTVVLVLRHGSDGAIGIVINRVTSLSPAKTFPELTADIGTYSGTLYRGGPVAPTRLLFLVRGLAAATVQGPEIVDKVFLSGDPESLPAITRLAEGPGELRMYAGHAEWTAGQLESEIKRGGWRVVPATADLVFSEEPGELWGQLLMQADEVVVDARSR
jgi:putative transcriptional regulator